MSKPKVYLRDLKKTDAHQYVKIAKDNKELYKFARFFVANTAEEASNIIDKNSNFFPGDHMLGIFRTKTNQLVGAIILSEYEGYVRVHYFVGKKFKRKGYTYEAINVLSGLIKNNQLSFEGQPSYMLFEVNNLNKASIALQEKLGSKLESSKDGYRYYRLNIN